MYKGHQRKYASLFVASLFSCLTIFQLGTLAQAQTSVQTSTVKKAKAKKLAKKQVKKASPPPLFRRLPWKRREQI